MISADVLSNTGQLNADMRSDDVLRRGLRSQLESLFECEQGIIRHAEAEQLHDFRVALRRARVLLGQVKKIFKKQHLKPIQQGLDWLGEVTGPCRDLDVWLEALPRYMGLVSAEHQPQLEVVHVYLLKRRKKYQARLVRKLNSVRYQKLKLQLDEFVNSNASSLAKNAAKPVHEIADKYIARAWKKVIRRGKKIQLESPVEKYHRLRIRCKNLRYLMNAFADLYSLHEIEFLTNELKLIQSSLGAYQDTEVHLQSLHELVASMAVDHLLTPESRSAIYKLHDELLTQAQKQRMEFIETFKDFKREEVQDRFLRLFVDK